MSSDGMLVLTRLEREWLQIDLDGGETIEVHVLRSTGHAVRLGIKAPRRLNIARSELIDVANRKPLDRPLGGK